MSTFYDQIICFGDRQYTSSLTAYHSLTQHGWDPLNAGWGAALQDVYSRRLDVICRGFSGTNSFAIRIDNCRIYDRSTIFICAFRVEHAKLLLPAIVPKVVPKNGSKIVLFIFFFGANDSTLEGKRQHVQIQPCRPKIRFHYHNTKQIFEHFLAILC